MSISVVVDNKQVDVKFLTFSDGGEYLRINLPSEINQSINVTIKDEPASRYMWLISLVDSIIYKNQIDNGKFGDEVSVGLNLPYFPFARADRSFEEGMVSPLENFLYFLDSTNFQTVYTNDLHNRIPMFDLLSMNYAETPQYRCLRDTLKRADNIKYLMSVEDGEVILIAPDKGATKKTEQAALYYESEYWVCDKKRNPTNGYIEDINLITEGNPEGKDFLIVDDICDGGMTFSMTADMLKRRGASSVSLYVTHGIFSKGLTTLQNIDNIFCYQTVMNYVTMKDIQEFNK